jgi:ligand-binding SRPBCC domain-containing protein
LGEFRNGAELCNLENEPMNVCRTASGTPGDLRFGRKDGLFTVETRLFLPRPLEIVFPFFADAGNLEAITPPWLRFEIVEPRPTAMRAAAFIEYRLRLHGIPLHWQSEITAWEPPHRFVDEQSRGPYRVWIHEHTFAERDSGTEVRDFVRYAAPGGWLVERMFIRHDVRRIFEYRARKLQEIFV